VCTSGFVERRAFGLGAFEEPDVLANIERSRITRYQPARGNLNRCLTALGGFYTPLAYGDVAEWLKAAVC
jgi:hypothetical protein